MDAGGHESIDVGDLRIEIDPRGGRVVSFRRGDHEALLGPEVDPENYGSTIWTSPQADWGWPPPPEFDRAPFAVERPASGVVVLTGPIEPRLGVRLRKRFSADPVRGAIACECVIDNAGDAPRRIAPWQVSRVAPGGLTFHPTGDRAGGPLPVVHRAGATWYEHRPSTLDATGQKACADGRGGFIAHVARSVLFVKAFDDLRPDEQAPGEGEVEIYGNDRYVEVEAQGPWLAVPPGGSSPPWTVRWCLRAVPASVDVSLGSAELVAFAEAVAR